jgi:hypothetical protein
MLRALTPVETAVAVAIAGSLLAIAVPAFVRNLHASRLAEPIEGLDRIGMRATARAAGRPAVAAYPESVGLTPHDVPRGKPVNDPAGTWDHPTWRELGFTFQVPHSYSFAFESKNSPGHATFRARAMGDLDGDGLYSSFELAGESRDGAEPVVFTLEMMREIE